MRSPTLKLILSLFAAVLFPTAHAVHYGRSTDLFGKLNTGADQNSNHRASISGNPSARAGASTNDIRKADARMPPSSKPFSRISQDRDLSFSRRRTNPTNIVILALTPQEGIGKHWPIETDTDEKIPIDVYRDSESDIYFQFPKTFSRASFDESTSAPMFVIANRKLPLVLEWNAFQAHRWIEAWAPRLLPDGKPPSSARQRTFRTRRQRHRLPRKIRNNTWIILWLKSLVLGP